MNLKFIFANAAISVIIFLVGFFLVNQFVEKQIAPNSQGGQNQPNQSVINGQAVQNYARTVETSNFSGTIKTIAGGQITLKVNNQEDNIKIISVQSDTAIYKFEFPDSPDAASQEIKKIQADLSSLKVGQKIFVVFNSDVNNNQTVKALVIGIYSGDKK